MTSRCATCLRMLTDDEILYGAACEVCEGGPSHDVDVADLFSVPLTRDQIIEAAGALFGVLGTVLLATKADVAGWGFVAFLASNIGWLAFSWIRGHWFMFAQQVCFTLTSLLGIWNWLLLPLLLATP